MNFLVYPKCENCSLRCANSPTVPGKGELNPDLFIIGEAPGGEEHYAREPFVGKSGKLLKATIDAIQKQTKREFTCYYTNTVLCRPPDNRNPTDNEVANCFGRLVSEIETVKPKKILLLGAVALKALLNLNGITKIRGRVQTYNSLPTLATWHPAYILRNQGAFQTMVDDIVRLLDYGSGEDWTTPRIYKLITNEEECLDCFRCIESDTSCLDIETFGLDYYTGHLLWVGLRTSTTTFIIPNEIFSQCAKYFPENTHVTVHRSQMEWPWMKHKYGIDLRNIDDTLLMGHILDERTKGVHKDLKTMGEEFLGVPPWDKAIEPYKKRMHLAPLDILHEYLAYDVEVGRALYFDLRESLEKDGTLSCYENVIKPCIPLVNRMSYRGIRVDMEYLEALQEEVKEEVNTLKNKLRDIAGNSNLNPNSTAQLSYLLFHDLGLPNIAKNSTDEKTITTLLKMVGEHEFLSTLLEYRGVQKILSTYVKGLYEACNVDGRIHADFLLEGTSTGRLSSKRPNLQNIPRPETSKWNIRKAFLPEEGCVLADFDYSQLEFRVGVHMANDEEAIKFLIEDRDIHLTMASGIVGKPIDQISKIERQFAKNMVFAVMFDASIDGLVYTFKKDFPFLDKALATKAINLIRGSFPQLYLNALEFKNFAIKNMYIDTLFGRRRRFPLITNENREDILKQATNTPIQGTASDICLLAAKRVDETFSEVKIHLLVHDSIVASIPPNFNIENVQEIMADVPFESRVPFKTACKVSDRWGM